MKYVTLRDVEDPAKRIHYSNMLSYLMDCSGTNLENRLIEKGFDPFHDSEVMIDARLLVEQFFNDPNQHAVLAVDKEDKAVGFIQFTYKKEDERCLVNHLYVTKKHRRSNNNIGVSLVNEAVKLITFSGMTPTTLTFERVINSEATENFFEGINAKLMYSTYGIVL